MEIHPYSAFQNKIPHIVNRFSQGQKRSSRGDLLWNFFLKLSRKQTEFHLLKMDLKPRTGQRITLKNRSPQWVVYLGQRDSHVIPVSRYLYFFWQLSIDHNMDVQYQVKQRWYMPWIPSSRVCHSHSLTWRGGRTYVRTILSEPKFLECIDNQIFLPMVLRCAKVHRSANNVEIFLLKLFCRNFARTT